MKIDNQKNDDIMVQAGLLAVAGILSRVIGLLYKSPLNSVITPLGLGYYTQAYNYYTIVLLISSYSIPSAISKVIAQKLAVHEYKNAHRTFIGALIYVLIVGTIGSGVLFFCAKPLVGTEAAPVLKVFAPTIMLYGILGVLRGYFQAHKSMLQTSCSQIIEQIVNAIVSVSAAYYIIKITMGTMAIPIDTQGQVKRAVNGAMGSALGTGLGVLAGLIFMVWTYFINRKGIKDRIDTDTEHKVESYKDIFIRITLVVTPFILSTAIYNLSASLNQTIFLNKSLYPSWCGRALETLTAEFGVLSGQSLTVSNIPVAFASAMASAMIPSVATYIAAQQLNEAKEKIALSVKTIMMISIPCAAGMFVVAKPIICIIFRDTRSELQMAAYLLMALAPSIVFYALSTLNSSILQGIGKVVTPIINAAIALLIQTVLLVVLLAFTDLGIYSIVVANTVYSGFMYLLNQSSVRKAINYKQEHKRTFIIPAISSIIMGAVVWVVYKVIYLIVHYLYIRDLTPFAIMNCKYQAELLAMRVAVIPAIVVGIIVYFALMVLLKGVTKEELLAMPKGNLIVKIAKKMKLLR